MNDNTKTPADFDRALVNFILLLQDAMDAHQRSRNFLTRTKVRVDNEGRKFVRVVSDSSAYCFIERATGNILKPASFKTPAKGSRGNIYGENPLAGCGPYGVQYLNHATALFPAPKAEHLPAMPFKSETPAERDAAWAAAEAGPTLEVVEVTPDEQDRLALQEDRLMAFLDRT